MTKIRFILLSLFVFFSSQAYSGMEQTRTCIANIKSFQEEISSLQKQINILLINEQAIELKCKNLEKAKNGFSNLPLIPSGIRKWKVTIINKDIAKIKSDLEELSKQKITTEKILQDKQSELNREQNKLHTYKFITIKSIKVSAWGNWDLFIGPEIIVKLGDETIARGFQDSYDLLASSLSEDATNYDSLKVYDEDPSHNEYMGEIPLEKNTLPIGVSGDFGIKAVKGSKNSNTKSAGFSYTVEYEVEY